MLANLHGTASYYSLLPYSNVLIQRSDGESTLTTEETFDALFYRLDDELAALKEDCIEYVIISNDKPVCDYPDWFAKEVQETNIYFDDEICILHDELVGDIAVCHGSVILRNYKGELMHMEWEEFDRYYRF